MKKKVYIRCFAAALAIIVSIVFAFFAGNFFAASNTARYTSTDKLKDGKVCVGSWFIKENFGNYADVTPEDVVNSYISALSEFPDVLVVSPTGNIKCQYCSITQEVVVEQVIRGGGIRGETVYCIFEGADVCTEESGAISLLSYGINLMQPGKQYVLFGTETDMSNYSEQRYYLTESGICYFALEDTNVAAAVETEGKCTSYAEVADAEFFVASEDMIEPFLEFKHTILEACLPQENYGDYIQQ